MEGLTFKKAFAEHHREALQSMEAYFGVNGLLAKSTVTYKSSNLRMQWAIAAATGVQTAGRHAGLTGCVY